MQETLSDDEACERDGSGMAGPLHERRDMVTKAWEGFDAVREMEHAFLSIEMNSERQT